VGFLAQPLERASQNRTSRPDFRSRPLEAGASKCYRWKPGLFYYRHARLQGGVEWWHAGMRGAWKRQRRVLTLSWSRPRHATKIRRKRKSRDIWPKSQAEKIGRRAKKAI